MVKRIMVPLDGSELAEAVLPVVCTIAKDNNAEILLLRVAEYPYAWFARFDSYPFYDPEFATKTADRKKSMQAGLTKYLDQIASNLRQERLHVTTEVCAGPVVDTILASIDRFGIDLVVMSTLGDGGRKAMMLGSVADRILRESKMQVCLVRPNQGEIKSDKPPSQPDAINPVSHM